MRFKLVLLLTLPILLELIFAKSITQEDNVKLWQKYNSKVLDNNREISSRKSEVFQLPFNNDNNNVNYYMHLSSVDGKGKTSENIGKYGLTTPGHNVYIDPLFVEEYNVTKRSVAQSDQDNKQDFTSGNEKTGINLKMFNSNNDRLHEEDEVTVDWLFDTENQNIHHQHIRNIRQINNINGIDLVPNPEKGPEEKPENTPDNKQPGSETINETEKKESKEPSKETINEPAKEPELKPDNGPEKQPEKELEKPPGNEPDKQPENVPEINPVNKLENEPSKETKNEPEKQPELKPDNGPEKQPEKELEKPIGNKPEKETENEPQKEKEPLNENGKEPEVAQEKEPEKKPQIIPCKKGIWLCWNNFPAMTISLKITPNIIGGNVENSDIGNLLTLIKENLENQLNNGVYNFNLLDKDYNVNVQVRKSVPRIVWPVVGFNNGNGGFWQKWNWFFGRNRFRGRNRQQSLVNLLTNLKLGVNNRTGMTNLPGFRWGK